jgi:hypothetical protein
MGQRLSAQIVGDGTHHAASIQGRRHPTGRSRTETPADAALR